jgi:MFS family permease
MSGTRTAVPRNWLINRNYALFMGGSFISALGSWFQGVAIGWLVLDLTGSPFVLGLTNFMLMAPLFFLGVAGGVLADRVERRRLLLGGLSTSALALGLLAALAMAGRASVGAILAISLVVGLTQAVVWPAWQPFIKDLVPAERLPQAIAFNSARFNLTRVLGPALAGVLLARIGAPACLAIAAGSSAGVIAATWLIRPPERRRGHLTPWRSALGEGVEYLRADPVARLLLLLTGATGLVVLPYQAFLPAFARDELQIGATGLGVLLAAVGVGAVFGALLSGTRLAARRPALSMAAFSFASGAGLAAFALSTPARGAPVWLAIAALALTGLGSIGYQTMANATLQLRVPDALIGRVMGVWVVVNAGVTPLGSLALGGVAERFGLPVVLFWCGVAGIAIAALLARVRIPHA